MPVPSQEDCGTLSLTTTQAPFVQFPLIVEQALSGTPFMVIEQVPSWLEVEDTVIVDVTV